MKKYNLSNEALAKYYAIVEENIQNIRKGNKTYLDPDRFIVEKKEVDGFTEAIRLSPDGICGITYLLKYYELKDNDKELAEAYKTIRSKIILWPKHRQNINQRRYACFRDRIDFTLYDISRFYAIVDKENRESRLIRKGSDSARFLNQFADFPSFAEEYEFDKSFVDIKTGKVFNLSKENEETISSYEDYEFSEKINKKYLNNLIDKLKKQRQI